MKKIIILMLSVLFFYSCGNDNNTLTDEEKLALAEKECSERTKIDELPIYFYGYFPQDADTINIKIKRGNSVIKDYNDRIPMQITDSLRHLREYHITEEILLTDTVIIKIKNEPEKKAYNFKYIVNPHYTMSESNYGCDYYEVTVNKEVIEGGTVSFVKQGFGITIDREKFKEYYKK